MPSSMPRVSMSSKSRSSYILSFDYSDIDFVIPHFEGIGKDFTFEFVMVIITKWNCYLFARCLARS